MNNNGSGIKINNGRIEWIDILKGIAIVLVVFGHIYSNEIVFKWLYSFHVPIFFFAGGYVYKQRSVLYDLKRRFQTIMIPYFFFGTLNLIYWIVLERKFRPSSLTVPKAFCGLLLGQRNLLDFNIHLWFLPAFLS